MNSSLSPGTTLGGYQVHSKIGEGGMGEVYRARDTKLNRDVAIKVLPAAFSADVERLRRFEQEAQAAGALNHPNILVIFHIGTYEGTPYIVSELLEGGTLREHLGAHASSVPLPQRKAIDYALQIAHGLAAAHTKGIVHRDLKPDNLFVTSDGRVKILDFGLAKLTGASDGAQSQTDIPTRRVDTDPGIVMGTMGYMSPEQLRGKPADHRSDIFSFGAVFYEMLSGKRAFRGDSMADTMSAILREDPPDLSETNKTVSPALERVVRHCLEKSPDERFHSARDLAFAIEALSGSATSSGQTTTISTLPEVRPRTRERFAWIVAGAAFLALLAAIPFIIAYFRRSPEDVTVVRFSISLPEKTRFFSDGETNNLSVSPDGHRIAFVAWVGSQRQLYVRALDQIEAQPLADTAGASAPFWSPDSRVVAFFAGDKLKKIEASGGAAQTICDGVAGKTRGGSWGRDGTIIFSHDGPAFRGIYRVNAVGGAPTQSFKADKLFPDWVSFLPDGRHFLFDVRKRSNEDEKKQPGNEGVYVGSLDSQETTLLFHSPNTRIEYATPGYLLFVHESVLLAQGFDASSLRLKGDPFVVLDHLSYFDKTGWAEFSVSENGVLVYGNNILTTRLAWFDRTGREVGRVGAPAMYTSPRLSPDGLKLSVSAGDAQTLSGDILIYDLARDTPTRFAFGPTDDGSPVWSPDGRRLAYFSCCDGGKSSLRIKEISDTAGSGQSPLAQGFAIPSDWSADGRFIVYDLGDPLTQTDLWVLPLDPDQKPSAFLRTPFNEHDGQFSPDGRFIAYVSNESGREEVYVRRFPGTNEQWLISSGGGAYPEWRRDGKELFYVDASDSLMAAQIDAGNTFSAVPATLLFPMDLIYGGGYTVARDGQRFLINTSAAGEQSTPFSVTLNWNKQLKK